VGNNAESNQWHRETITASTEATLCALRDRSLLGGACLAGGTGLALHFGHRLSMDLDFFVKDAFDEEVLLQRMQAVPEFSLVAKAPQTLHANILGTKVSFLGYAYPILFPPSQFLGIPVADPRDIACMKINAIANRGTKRDFIDLYVASRRFGLEEILRLFARKFSQTGYNRMHILKSLIYFDDAEKDPMPHMLVTLAWDDVQSLFLDQVPRFV
jgi:hypothetical protein